MVKIKKPLFLFVIGFLSGACIDTFFEFNYLFSLILGFAGSFIGFYLTNDDKS